MFLGLCFNMGSPGSFKSSESWLTMDPSCFQLQVILPGDSDISYILDIVA